MDRELSRLYYTPGEPGSYTGPQNLRSLVRGKYAVRDVTSWLREQDAYNLHKRFRKNFPRRTYNVSNMDDVWEIDLMDLRALAAENDNFKFVLVAIDVLSKFAFAEPMKNKSAEDTTHAFSTILKHSDGRLPITLQCDKGREFVNAKFKAYLAKKNIIFRLVRDPDVKAACVERFIRTLKTRLWRYFTQKRTRRYVDVLQNFITAYNNTVHSGISMRPACINLYNAAIAKKNLHERYRGKTKKAKYAVGTYVRVSRAPNVFRKGYERGWSLELFKIVRVSNSRQPPVYFVEDLNNEPIEGFYYEEEINPVKKPDLFEIEDILETRGSGKNKKCLIRWKGYPPKFDSWLPAAEIREA